MNILITGGAGFIASHIAEKYVSLGHNVVILDNLTTGSKSYMPSAAKLIEADIRDNNIYDILKDNNIEIINHHAAKINLRSSVENPIDDLDVNVEGSVNLFQSALKAGVVKIIFASSGGAVYGAEENLPATEEVRAAPKSPYGINKMTAEKYLNYYKVVHGLSSVVLRYANAYGPRQSSGGESGVIAIFCDKLLNNEQAVINGDGLQTRDYVFVDDIVKANVLALQNTKHSIYNIGTGKETTVNYVFDKLNEIAGTDFKEVHGPAKLGEQIRSSLSSKRIESELGWKPEVGIDEGLKRTFEFFKNRRNK